MGCASFPRCSRTPSVRSSQMLQRTSCSRFAVCTGHEEPGLYHDPYILDIRVISGSRSHSFFSLGSPLNCFITFLSPSAFPFLTHVSYPSFSFFSAAALLFPCCRPAPASLSRSGASSLSLSADIKVSHAAPLARHKLRPLVFTDFPSLRSSF